MPERNIHERPHLVAHLLLHVTQSFDGEPTLVPLVLHTRVARISCIMLVNFISKRRLIFKFQTRCMRFIPNEYLHFNPLAGICHILYKKKSFYVVINDLSWQFKEDASICFDMNISKRTQNS